MTMFCLLRAYVAKANGHRNPEYGTKVVNCILAIAATNASAMDFVSANLMSILIRHIERLRSAWWGTPIVLKSPDEMGLGLGRWEILPEFV